jgi:RimJ/RimL family protein N-acetyltransferase
MEHLRKTRKEDIEMVFKWLSQPDHEKIFGDPLEWKEEMENHVEKESWLQHFIFEIENEPAGFCQYYDCTEAGEGPWENETEGTYGIDFLLLENFRGQGNAQKMLEFLLSVLKENPSAHFVIADPDAENHASIAILKKMGFKKEDNGLFKKQL